MTHKYLTEVLVSRVAKFTTSLVAVILAISSKLLRNYQRSRSTIASRKKNMIKNIDNTINRCILFSGVIPKKDG